MDENDIAKEIVDASLMVHRTLGPGLLESAYETALDYELTKRGLRVDRQAPIPIRYDGIEIGEAYRADLLIEGKVIVELKSVEQVSSLHKKQLLTYLKLSGARLGLLINFGAELLKKGITRIANQMPERSD